LSEDGTPNGNNNQILAATAESALLVVRPVFFMRHRRISSALWFGLWAALAAFLIDPVLRCPLGGPVWTWCLGAAISALMPGLVFGASILDQKVTKSKRAAAGRGALVVLWAHITFAIFMCVPQGFNPNGWGFDAVPMSLIMQLFVGWLTFPIGAGAGVLLYALRHRASGPRGCAIHGYTHRIR
jgi:hypothetical protein